MITGKELEKIANENSTEEQWDKAIVIKTYDWQAIANKLNQQTCETCNMCDFCSQSIMQEIEYPGAWEEVSINGCSYYEPKSQEILELIKNNKQKEQS